jgi:hypothetical protein
MLRRTMSLLKTATVVVNRVVLLLLWGAAPATFSA